MPLLLLTPGMALQIQCYQCEEVTQNECSTPEFIVNCTVNVQNMCQMEVLVKEDGETFVLCVNHAALHSGVVHKLAQLGENPPFIVG